MRLDRRVSLSLLVTMKEHKQEIRAIAVNVARAYIDKDILFRDWNALHDHNFAIGEKVTCSFGVTQFCGTDTVDVFVNRADETMYKAKKGGRNRVVESSC